MHAEKVPIRGLDFFQNLNGCACNKRFNKQKTTKTIILDYKYILRSKSRIYRSHISESRHPYLRSVDILCKYYQRNPIEIREKAIREIVSSKIHS